MSGRGSTINTPVGHCALSLHRLCLQLTVYTAVIKLVVWLYDSSLLHNSTTSIDKQILFKFGRMCGTQIAKYTTHSVTQQQYLLGSGRVTTLKLTDLLCSIARTNATRGDRWFFWVAPRRYSDTFITADKRLSLCGYSCSERFNWLINCIGT